MKTAMYKYICAIIVFGITFYVSLGMIAITLNAFRCVLRSIGLNWLGSSESCDDVYVVVAIVLAIILAVAAFVSICHFWKTSAALRRTAAVIGIILVCFAGMIFFASLFPFSDVLFIWFLVSVFVGWIITELSLFVIWLVRLMLRRCPAACFTWKTRAIGTACISVTLMLLFICFITLMDTTGKNHGRVQEIIDTMKQADILLLQKETREEGIYLLESVGFFNYADLQRPNIPASGIHSDVKPSGEAFFHSNDQRLFAVTIVFDPNLEYAKSQENPDMIDGRERYMPPDKRALPGMPNWPKSEFYRRVVEDYRHLKMSGADVDSVEK